MYRLYLIPAVLALCGGIAWAQTSSNQEGSDQRGHQALNRHSMVQQGERNQNPSNPRTASPSQPDHQASNRHSMVQQGERSQNP
jgi:hypothetical protein